MGQWTKEPLLHFLVIGAVIFALFSVVNKEEKYTSSNKIVISTADIERLSNNWSRKWNRPPTSTELKGLVDSYIREEVYYREALALGLDKDDTVLRRRLMQKMEFLSNDLADLASPDETALNEYFHENKDQYELPAQISFTHIYFSLDKRGVKAPEDARRVLGEIQAASSPLLREPSRGDPIMLEYDFTQETPFEVARLFGQRFAGQLFELETDAWQGPIQSGYGYHLVRISEKVESRMPELASVVDQVRRDFMYEHRQKTNKAIYERFKERYEIVVEEMPDQSGTAEASAPGSK